MLSDQEYTELVRVVRLIRDYFGSRGWSLTEIHNNKPFEEWLQLQKEHDAGWWSIASRTVLGNTYLLLIRSKPLGVELRYAGTFVPFSSEDVKWLDKHGINLTEEHTRDCGQRVEDWIYDE